MTAYTQNDICVWWFFCRLGSWEQWWYIHIRVYIYEMLFVFRCLFFSCVCVCLNHNLFTKAIRANWPEKLAENNVPSKHLILWIYDCICGWNLIFQTLPPPSCFHCLTNSFHRRHVLSTHSASKTSNTSKQQIYRTHQLHRYICNSFPRCSRHKSLWKAETINDPTP